MSVLKIEPAKTIKKIVGKYKVSKRPDADGVVYFLRCFWHLVNDEISDHVISWKDDDKFMIPDEKALDNFLKTYDGFKGNMNTFRRSLYFYGFKKVNSRYAVLMKNTWTHPNLDKNSRSCLLNIKRKSSTKKDKQMKLRTQYMQLMLAQMKSMHGMPGMQFPYMKMNLSPTNFDGLQSPYMPAIHSGHSSSSGNTTSPENDELMYLPTQGHPVHGMPDYNQHMMSLASHGFNVNYASPTFTPPGHLMPQHYSNPPSNLVPAQDQINDANLSTNVNDNTTKNMTTNSAAVRTQIKQENDDRNISS